MVPLVTNSLESPWHAQRLDEELCDAVVHELTYFFIWEAFYGSVL